MRARGMLFVFCGLDGSGKTTQAQLLASALEKMGVPAHLTSEPTSWYLKDPFVRSYFAEAGATERGLASLALFSAADRARHIDEEIIPNMDAGKIVVCSRYVFSAYAYFWARGLKDETWLKTINRYIIPPNLTFFLDIEPEIAIERIARRGEWPKKEERDVDALAEIRRRFLSFSSHDFLILDATLASDELHQRIVSLVEPMLLSLHRV